VPFSNSQGLLSRCKIKVGKPGAPHQDYHVFAFRHVPGMVYLARYHHVAPACRVLISPPNSSTATRRPPLNLIEVDRNRRSLQFCRHQHGRGQHDHQHSQKTVDDTVIVIIKIDHVVYLIQTHADSKYKPPLSSVRKVSEERSWVDLARFRLWTFSLIPDCLVVESGGLPAK